MNFIVESYEWTFLSIKEKFITVEFKQFTQDQEEELNKSKKIIYNYKPNNEVVAVDFCNFNIPVIPSNLVEYFPNFNILYLHNCGLQQLCRDDLKHFPKLKHFHVEDNAVEEVHSDLFQDLDDLEEISLRNNKIKFIGRNVFKHLEKLKCVDLRTNPLFDMVYADESIQNPSIDKNTTRIYKLKEFNTAMLGFAVECAPHLPASFHDVYEVMKKEESKDFSIKIAVREFKAHKLMLIARSPTLAEMIKNNPDADELILEDIEVEVFKIILDYIYEDKMPIEYGAYSHQVFTASEKLKLIKLKLHMGELIAKNVSPKNSLDILIMAVRNNHEGLKKKAFDEVKKLYPDIELKHDLMDKLEVLQRMKKLREEMEKLLTNA